MTVAVAVAVAVAETETETETVTVTVTETVAVWIAPKREKLFLTKSASMQYRLKLCSGYPVFF